VEGRKTYVNENLELWVIGHLIVNEICRDGVIWNIFQIRMPKVQNCIVQHGGDALDGRMFLSLDLKELLQEPFVMSMQFPKVLEHISDECAQSLLRDNGWVRRT